MKKKENYNKMSEEQVDVMISVEEIEDAILHSMYVAFMVHALQPTNARRQILREFGVVLTHETMNLKMIATAYVFLLDCKEELQNNSATELWLRKERELLRCMEETMSKINTAIAQLHAYMR